ncbi:MAG: alpha/beta hydrolase, partial [Marivirga sp.]|nr:alpha/beta hydrolase [Marivirga sp.]
PEQIILLCPWLDITMNNPAIIQMDSEDPFLGIEGLKKAGKAYAGNSTMDHYLLSPVNGSLEGLARISLFIGSRDILVADARKLFRLAQSNDIDLNYREYKGMFHVWMLMNFPESKRAAVEIIQLIRN